MSTFYRSYWERQGDQLETDLAIVGCGIVGLNAGISYLEAHPGAEVLILERGIQPDGASTRNAGFACFGSPGELMDDLRSHPEEEVFALFKRRYLGILELLRRNEGTDIGFDRCGGYEVMTREFPDECLKPSDLEYLNVQIEESIGIRDYFRFADEELPRHGLLDVVQMVRTDHESLLDPYKLIRGLVRRFISLGGRILWGTQVQSHEDQGDKVMIHTGLRGILASAKLLYTVNGFAPKVLPELPVLSARNQVMVLRSDQVPPLRGAYHYHKGYVYFRPVSGGVLLGGARHLDPEQEFSDQLIFNPEIKNYLLDFANRHLFGGKKFEITDHWIGVMGLGPEKKPIVKMISSRTGVAVRMGGMGVAIGTGVGHQAAQMMGANDGRLIAESL